MSTGKFWGILFVLMVMVLAGCTRQQTAGANVVANQDTQPVQQENVQNQKQEEVVAMRLQINGVDVPVTWEDNPSTRALQKLLPLNITMSAYGGFEQVGVIGTVIERADTQITTNYGDIVLYNGDRLVIFYGSNSWSYTSMGHIDMSQQEITDMLSKGAVTVTITK